MLELRRFKALEMVNVYGAVVEHIVHYGQEIWSLTEEDKR